MHTDKKYWFRPARFWGRFAFYYPASRAGWAVTVVLGMAFVKIFFFVDWHSHSGSDTLISFAPWAIAIFLVFDLLCFRFGEYPPWWKRKED